MNKGTVFSSFRDPSGFLFWQDGILYRQINKIYKDNYSHLIQSGLYKVLIDDNLLIPHDEINISAPQPESAYKIIKPQQIPFISYPYEWCFSQLKDAAITTLKIQNTALDYGMSLKDCSAFNIQFYKCNPVLIDTLSFEKYEEGKPWVAYRQFCQHFIAPLALMSYKDVRLNQLFRIYIDGIPLDLASSLLPGKTRFSIAILSHIHLHAKSQAHYAEKQTDTKARNLSKMGLLGIIDHLESCIKKLTWQPYGTEWADYYEDTNYSSIAFEHKKRIVADYLVRAKPSDVWDLGSNTGIFSKLANDMNVYTISCDNDAAAVERNYLESRSRGDTNVLPLVIDISNPSPGIGWQNKERASFENRGPADTVMALALIHHLAISNNLPFNKIAEYFYSISNSFLIIEFVPKSDSQVQRLLSTREDIFPEYTKESFELVFSRYYTIIDSSDINESQRTIYFLKRKQV